MNPLEDQSIKDMSVSLTLADLDKRLAIIEVKMVNAENILIEVKKEYIPNLQNKLDKVHDRITFWGGAIAVLTFIVPMIINYLIK